MDDAFWSVTDNTMHPCYVFMQRFHTCLRRESLYSRMCVDEFEDYFECLKKRKLVHFFVGQTNEKTTNLRKQLLFRVVSAEQARKVEILKFPKYDYSTDTFQDLPKDFDVNRHFKKPTADQGTTNNAMK